MHYSHSLTRPDAERTCICSVQGWEITMARDFSKAFYHSKEWEQVRAYVLMRDRYICQRCGLPAQEVHHIIHLSPDNIWDTKVTLNPENLISLCKGCHFEQHVKDKEAGKRKKHGLSEGDCREGYHFDELGQLVPD